MSLVSRFRSVDGQSLGMRACSACAGDYEDPDRTAWEPTGRDAPEDGGTSGLDSEELAAEK